ncbi:helix-turn-helix domain-containing protein [Paenactinomyces guangxiensis]|uniref:Helix-turn-helix domain-containing protein n=1 Tax=Paenactinomyces guangxiensis TaxID=1490290 RepID=A0A7W1WQY0_9BACL|nr:helix-turn-helix domain-containing protein [Paenactinomyces guangxiensis]MBA4494406.1 helix-turn-helix domain-containing protein [Paenactinomyces guangxiensis]MBH8591539.1 helix-turn-helix domain-containing protein [Paenactinomyces guangxiensis]
MSVEIGKRLKQARESMGLSLEDLEARTRIQKKYLIALENGQFGLLPSPIYVRSYLRSYANVVGENPQTILKQYRPNTRSSRHPEENSSFRNDLRRDRPVLPPAHKRGAFRYNQSYGQQSDLSPTQTFSDLPYRSNRSSDQEEEHNADYEISNYGSESRQQSDLGYSRSARSVRSRNSAYHDSAAPDSTSYPAYASATPAIDEESLSLAETSATSSPGQPPRKPKMPSDVPDPEELGLDSSESYDKGLQRSSSFPSRRSVSRSQSSRSEGLMDEDRRKKSGFSFGKLYNWLLIIGTVLLVLALAGFFYIKMTTASGKADKQPPPEVAKEDTASASQTKPVGKPIFTMLSSSEYKEDRYELVNAEKLELKMVSQAGGASDFEIREQEVGNPVAKGSVAPGKEYTKSFTTGIWLKLDRPNRVKVTVNGKPVITDRYRKEKDIYISFVR